MDAFSRIELVKVKQLHPLHRFLRPREPSFPLQSKLARVHLIMVDFIRSSGAFWF